jgi:hypothetical protein
LSKGQALHQADQISLHKLYDWLSWRRSWAQNV